MKFIRTLVSLTIAGMLAACGGGGGGGGNNGGDTGGGDTGGGQIPDNGDAWQAIQDDDGNVSFIQALYSNGKIWLHSKYSLATNSSQLMSTDDEGETLTAVDDSRYHLMSCISDAGRIFYGGYNIDYVDDLNFGSPTPYNLEPSLADMESAGILFDRNGDEIIDDNDLVDSVVLNQASIINCNNHPMFGMAALHEDHAYFSYDHGHTWFHSEAIPGEIPFIQSFTPITDDAGGMYLPTKTGLVRSTNGRQWAATDFGEAITSIVNNPKTQNRLLAVSETGKLYTSFDNGSSWDATGQLAEDLGGLLKTPSELVLVANYSPVLAVAEDGEIIAAGIVNVSSDENKPDHELRIYRTFNNGDYWDQLTTSVSPIKEGVEMTLPLPKNVFITDNYYWFMESKTGTLIAENPLYRLPRQ